MIAAYEAIEEVDDRRESFGFEKDEAPKLCDCGFLGFRQEAAGDDQYRNVSELGNLTEIFQHVEPREPIRQAHIEHCCDDWSRTQQLDCAIDRFGLDTRVPRTSQESPCSVPDEWLIVQDENGRCGRGNGIRLHEAAYVR
jgi:hypothetical protein